MILEMTVLLLVLFFVNSHNSNWEIPSKKKYHTHMPHSFIVVIFFRITFNFNLSRHLKILPWTPIYDHLLFHWHSNLQKKTYLLKLYVVESFAAIMTQGHCHEIFIALKIYKIQVVWGVIIIGIFLVNDCHSSFSVLLCKLAAMCRE